MVVHLKIAELYDPARGTWMRDGSWASHALSHGDAAAQWPGAGGGGTPWCFP